MDVSYGAAPASRRSLRALRLGDPGPFVKKVFGTVSSQVAAAIIGTLVVGVIAKHLGPVEFGGYMLGRRVSVLLLSCCAFPLGIAVTRYTAIAVDAERRQACLLAGAVLTLGPGALFVAAALAEPSLASRLLLGAGQTPNVLTGMLALFFGSSCVSLLFSYYIGAQLTKQANLWQLATMSVGPLIIVFAPGMRGSGNSMLLAMGLVAIVAAFPMIYPAWRAITDTSRLSEIVGLLRPLAGYGVPRMPGGLAYNGILAVGPLLAARHGRVVESGGLLAAMTVLQLANLATSAFGYAILPKVAALHAEGRHDLIRKSITDILGLSLHAGSFMTVQLIIWANPLVTSWLGSNFVVVVPAIRILGLAIVPYCAYTLLRPVIDAVEPRAISTVILVSGFVVTSVSVLVSDHFNGGINGAAGAVAVGLTVVGLGAVGFICRRYGVGGGSLTFTWSVLFNTALGGAGWCSYLVLHRLLHGLALIGAAFVLELVFLAVYIIGLYSVRARWVMELHTRLVRSGPR